MPSHVKLGPSALMFPVFRAPPGGLSLYLTDIAAVVRHFLTMYKVEQQGYKSCMALLRLSDTYSADRVENACAKALTFTPAPSLKSIQSILKSGTTNLLAVEEEPEQTTPARRGFTRGADYYRRDK